nr:DUF2071 protein [uncultured bacterium]
MATAQQLDIRPPVLPFEVGLEIQGYVLINYPLPPERLAPHLPPGLVPALTTLDGQATAWFSVFLGRNVVRTIGGWRAFPLEFNLVNYRTYVEGPEGRRLFIFRSLMGPQLLAVGARLLPQLPADPHPFYFAPRIVDDRLLALEAEVGEAAHELRVVVETMDDAPWTPGFETPEAAVNFLGNVREGLFPLPDGRAGQMFTSHPPLAPEGGRLLEARFDWPRWHQILTSPELRRPASVFMQGRVDFPTRM